MAYMESRHEHRRQTHLTNPYDRLNKEIKRNANLVGMFPNDDSVLGLLGSVMMEQNDEYIMLRT